MHQIIILSFSLLRVLLIGVLNHSIFLDAWWSWLGFSAILKSLWNELCSNNANVSLLVKLKFLRHKLKVWNHDVFGHVKSLKKVYSKIDALETIAESRPLSDSESHLPIMLRADKAI